MTMRCDYSIRAHWTKPNGFVVFFSLFFLLHFSSSLFVAFKRRDNAKKRKRVDTFALLYVRVWVNVMVCDTKINALVSRKTYNFSKMQSTRNPSLRGMHYRLFVRSFVSLLVHGVHRIYRTFHRSAVLSHTHMRTHPCWILTVRAAMANMRRKWERQRSENIKLVRMHDNNLRSLSFKICLVFVTHTRPTWRKWVRWKRESQPNTRNQF